MLGDVNATVDGALADLLKKTCRRVGETTQGLVTLFERSEAERRQSERNAISAVSSSVSNGRNGEDESVQPAGDKIVRGALAGETMREICRLRMNQHCNG